MMSWENDKGAKICGANDLLCKSSRACFVLTAISARQKYVRVTHACYGTQMGSARFQYESLLSEELPKEPSMLALKYNCKLAVYMFFFCFVFCVSFCSIIEQSRWKNLSGGHNCSLVSCCFRIFSIPSLIFFAVFSNLSLCREVNVFPIEQKCDSHLIELLQLPGSYLAWKPANFSRVSCRFVPPMEPSCLDVSVWISSINLICNCAKVWKEGAFVFPFVVFLVYGRKHLKNALNVAA